ncbi:hypothetical protein [Agrobacterium tumefaciens]|uniref:hypothetical protein n=1 Tax=Agrobacterium tumefaciens TaxID=358 RepID=UPI0009763276|nr:hypothetical protein BV900_25375 [Agrobacterium tumefaciens]
MTTVSNVNSVALLMLQQAEPLTTAGQNRSSPDNLVAIANGVSERISVSKQPGQAESKISESMFSVNELSITKMKLDLIDRTGKALGVDQADYASREEFVNAMERALGKLKMEGGQAAVMALNKELGLDKLGISVEDVINSAKDPDANDKVTKALEKEAGKKADDTDAVSQPLSLKPNEIGLYGAPNL